MQLNLKNSSSPSSFVCFLFLFLRELLLVPQKMLFILDLHFFQGHAKMKPRMESITNFSECQVGFKQSKGWEAEASTESKAAAGNNSTVSKHETTLPAFHIKSAKKKTTFLVGFDLGTGTSRVVGSSGTSKENKFEKTYPTVVGYARDAIVDGVLPSQDKIFFGDDAVKFRSYLELKKPLSHGQVSDIAAAKGFFTYIRNQITQDTDNEVCVVLGVPSSTDEKAHDTLKNIATGIFDRMLLIPTPFLAALGFRDESKLNNSDYTDPIKHSLFVDIGAGSTDLCLIKGYYPKQEDQNNLRNAGDQIDSVFADSIQRQYPDTKLSITKVREIKEQCAYVGELQNGVMTKVLVNGKPKNIDVGSLVGNACNQYLSELINTTVQLVTRVHSDSVEQILQNIVICGGGSQISNIAPEVQRLLLEQGYEYPKVTTVGKNYQNLVALGAWKVARSTPSEKWQHL